MTIIEHGTINFWFGDVEWNHALEDNLRASVKVNTDGSIETTPNNEVFNSILNAAMNYQRSYVKIQSPSLVIYAKPFFHPPAGRSSTIKLYENLENNIVAPWRMSNRRRIETELQNVMIVDAPSGTHTSLLFLSEDFLVQTIKKFIDPTK